MENSINCIEVFVPQIADGKGGGVPSVYVDSPIVLGDRDGSSRVSLNGMEGLLSENYGPEM